MCVNGGCPKNRILDTPDGEPGLNFLCAGYKHFFTHIDPPMRFMAAELRRSAPGEHHARLGRGGGCRATPICECAAQRPVSLWQRAQVQALSRSRHGRLSAPPRFSLPTLHPNKKVNYESHPGRHRRHGQCLAAGGPGSPVVEYAGFVEVNAKIAAAQTAKYGLDGGKIFRTLDEALAAVEADGVINVTPPQFHREVSLTALEAGVPVLSEKPLADTRESAQDIVDAANRTGVLHMVAQNYRYQPGDADVDGRLAVRRAWAHRRGDGAVLPRAALWRLSRRNALSADHRHVDPSLRPDALFPRARPGERLWQELESGVELVQGRCVGRGDAGLWRRCGREL